VKTLLRATNWLGDVAMSVPALRALRASFPKDELWVLARPWVADLYRLRPEVDGIVVEENREAHAGRSGRERLAAELAARGFDRAVILPTSFGTAYTVAKAGIPERIGYRGEWRSPLLTRPVRLDLATGEHQVWKHLRLVAAAGAALPERPDTSWEVRQAELETGKAVLKAHGVVPRYAVAHVASFAHAAKRWDPARFAQVFTRLAAERRFTIVLLGSEAERGRNDEVASLVPDVPVVNLAGRTSLPELLGVLKPAALFLGNDSGISHLAAAVGTPTVVVFGATDPDATRPWDGPRPDGRPVRIEIVRSRTLCAPCRFTRCPLDHACMTGVSADHVLRAIGKVCG